MKGPLQTIVLVAILFVSAAALAWVVSIYGYAIVFFVSSYLYWVIAFLRTGQWGQ
jgi:hypothetical protein